MREDSALDCRALRMFDMEEKPSIVAQSLLIF